jgi:hypothetical protein
MCPPRKRLGNIILPKHGFGVWVPANAHQLKTILWHRLKKSVYIRIYAVSWSPYTLKISFGYERVSSDFMPLSAWRLEVPYMLCSMEDRAQDWRDGGRQDKYLELEDCVGKLSVYELRLYWAAWAKRLDRHICELVRQEHLPPSGSQLDFFCVIEEELVTQAIGDVLKSHKPQCS